MLLLHPPLQSLLASSGFKSAVHKPAGEIMVGFQWLMF